MNCGNGWDSHHLRRGKYIKLNFSISSVTNGIAAGITKMRRCDFILDDCQKFRRNAVYFGNVTTRSYCAFICMKKLLFGGDHTVCWWIRYLGSRVYLRQCQSEPFLALAFICLVRHMPGHRLGTATIVILEFQIRLANHSFQRDQQYNRHPIKACQRKDVNRI